MKAVVCLLAAAMLTGCATEKLQERPPRAQQVIELGRQGQAAYARGDLTRAAALFERALLDARHIEDSQSVAVMSINLSRVARDAGDSARALNLLAAVSPWHRAGSVAATAREMDLLAAVLLTDLERRDEARQRLGTLRAQCRTECEIAIGIDSLEARLMLEQSEAAAAAQLATAATARFADHPNRLELANLLRVQGEARHALGDFAAARRALEQALDIDKSLAQPGKIAQDLDALARAALAAGDGAAHAAYLARLRELRQAPAAGAAR